MMKTMLLAGTALALTMTSNPAHAQATPAPAPVSTAAQADDGLADIIVTAARRETTLQKTAIPVTAITADELARKGVVNVTEISKLAPAIKIGAVAGGSIQATVRGVGTFGGGAFNEPGIAFNLDGVYLARNQGAAGIFYDVARVELLKGPQGTLYGRNSTGGVLNVITNDPKAEFGGSATVELGNYGLKRASAALNIPVTPGVALRISGQGIDRDGFLSDGYDDDKGYGGRAKLKLDPTDDLSILLEASFALAKGKGFNFVFSPFVVPSDPYVGPSDPRSNALFNIPGIGPLLPRIKTDGFVDNRSRNLQATVNYDLGLAKATLIVANERNSSHYLQYSAGFPVSDDTRSTPAHYTTAEFRLASNGLGPVKWVLGTYYFDDTNTTNIFVNQGFTFGASKLRLRTKSISGFGEATVSVAPWVRLTAGGRYTSDDKRESGQTLGPPVPCLAPSSLGADPALGAVCVTPNVGQHTFNKFTYKLGAEADIGPRSLIYATYATGFKAGSFIAGPNSAPAGAFPTNAYQPETLRAWTIGSKNRFAGNRLQVNAEAFYWKYANKQVQHLGFVPPNNLLLVVDNAASAKVYGAEVDALWQVTPRDTLALNAQYLHAHYGRFTYNQVVPQYAQPSPPGAPVPGPVTGCVFTPTVGLGGAPQGVGVPGVSTIDCSGREISLAPEFVLNASLRHRFDLPGGSSLTPAISTQFQTAFWIGEEYFTGERQGSSTTTDIDLTWVSADTRFSLTAYIQNIEDKAIGQSAFLQPTLGRALINLRAPRTFGGRLTVNF